jgi:hypothetical protein
MKFLFTSLLVSIVVVLFSLSTACAAREPPEQECVWCYMTCNYISEWLLANATETFIEQKLQVLCDVAPSPLNQQCDALVMQYLPQLFQLISGNEWTYIQDLCGEIGACPPAKRR